MDGIHLGNLSQSYFSIWQCIEEIPKEYEKFINWREINNSSNIPEEIILKYWEKLEEISFTLARPLNRYSEKFAEEFLKSSYKWKILYIIKNTILSDSFILNKLIPEIEIDFPNKQYDTFLIDILTNQQISEETIKALLKRRIKKFLVFIVSYQKVSEDFLNKYKKYFTRNLWNTVFVNQRFSKRFLKKNFFNASPEALERGIAFMEEKVKIPKSILLYIKTNR